MAWVMTSSPTWLMSWSILLTDTRRVLVSSCAALLPGLAPALAGLLALALAAGALVDALAEAIGPDAAFRGELRHRGEHSLELVATWLHHMRGGRPVALLPILTGSFADFIAGRGDPADDAALAAFLATLRQRAWGQGRRVMVVASGDLAHVGPAFGGADVDAAGRVALRQADDELLQQLAAGSAAGFFAAIRRVEDRNNVCGVSPFYLALRLLGDVEGQVVAYDQCPADQRHTSLVSVCGMVFG